MARTASTIAGVRLWARLAFSLVAREVRATERRSSRSTSRGSLNWSRNCDSQQCSAGSWEPAYLQCFGLGNLEAVCDDTRV
jgi:hypothetical protein